MTPKSRGGKSHSGIPGSKAACAYPGRFRGLPRPSSAFKPSHSPDGVCVFGPCGSVCLAFGVNLFCWCASLLFACAWCHGELPFALFGAHFTLHSASLLVRGCISFFGWRLLFCWNVLEAFVADISVVSCGIRVFVVAVGKANWLLLGIPCAFLLSCVVVCGFAVGGTVV